MGYVRGLGALGADSQGYRLWQSQLLYAKRLATTNKSAALEYIQKARTTALNDKSVSDAELVSIGKDYESFLVSIGAGSSYGAQGASSGGVTYTKSSSYSLAPPAQTKTTDTWFATPVQVHSTWYSTGKLPSNTRIASGWILRDSPNGIQLVYPSQGIVHPVDGDSNPKPLSSFQNTTIRHWNTGEILYQSGSADDDSSGGILDSISSGLTSLFSSIGDAVPKVAPSIVQAVEQKRADTAARRAARSAQQETQEARAGLPSWVLPVGSVITLVSLGYWYTKPKQVAVPQNG